MKKVYVLSTAFMCHELGKVFNSGIYQTENEEEQRCIDAYIARAEMRDPRRIDNFVPNIELTEEDKILLRDRSKGITRNFLDQGEPEPRKKRTKKQIKEEEASCPDIGEVVLDLSDVLSQVKNIK